MNPIMLIVFAVVLVGMTYFQMRAQKETGSAAYGKP